MKKTNLLQLIWIAVFTLFSYNSNAAIDVSGHITSNATWSGYVSASDAIWVDAGVTLPILPGTNVDFFSYTMMYVNGSVHAIGTAGAKISFYNEYQNRWDGIILHNIPGDADSSIFVHCKVRDAWGWPYAPFYVENFYKLRLENFEIFNCNLSSAGAIKLSGVGAVIKNSYIHDNTTAGGIEISGSIVNISNTEIYNNSSWAVYTGGSDVTIVNSLIHHNGGGVYCGNILYISGCEIVSNSDNGICGVYANIKIENSLISQNSATYGGGARFSNSYININNCDISYNQASVYGGGIYTYQSCTGQITNNLIRNNVTAKGGGMYLGNCDSSMLVTNNVITDNNAGDQGGGCVIYCYCCYSVRGPLLINNTIANNSAPLGGGLSFRNCTSPNIKNCIIYGNSNSEGYL
ncbi:MAG: right-handed parallel beta-helix repeat-containing protein, partial [Bacteroidales bacterium]|nr:right-handed parallel beta-helix repeat-containing protein [Bacteroidales bacterium]